MTTRMVVLGAGYAGMMATLRLANRTRGRDVELTLVNDGAELVERIRNHELAASTPGRGQSIAALLDGTGVRFVDARVTALNPVRQIVALADGGELAWDRLVYTLGSLPDDAVPGAREHALPIGSERGARRLREALAAGARRLVVVGGGLTGVETASELAESHPSLQVTLVTSGPNLSLSAATRAHIAAALARLGVTTVEGTVDAVRAGALLVAGAPLPFDACAWAGGMVAPPLARAAGLAVNERGQLLVDAELRSVSHPSIHAAGDAAAMTVSAGAPLLMGCKTAMPMAAHVAENLARAMKGGDERPFRFGDSGLCISLGRRDAVVQLHHRDGTPRGLVRGRLAVWIKELICRFTVLSLRAERHVAFYRWLAPPALGSSERRRLTA